MAVDRRNLTENLSRFYDFSGKIVVLVGAGGGQLLDATIQTKKLIAIDRNAESVSELRKKAASNSRPDSVEGVASRFEEVTSVGDVVYFEFCLHEMDEPQKALAHAQKLALDLVVFEHSPGSPWVFHAAEENKVQRSCEAIERALRFAGATNIVIPMCYELALL